MTAASPARISQAPSPALASTARVVARQALVSAGAATLGFAILVALFKSGLFAGIDVLFYRGLVLCALTFVLTVAGLAALGRRVGGVDLAAALSAGVLSLGLNLSFLVIAPVTVDRSISVFILATMAEHDGETLSTAAVDALFRDLYLGRLNQIERRMHEQVLSGTIAAVPGGYRIAPGGHAFLRSARAVAWMFDTDTRLLDAARDARPSASGTDTRR